MCSLTHKHARTNSHTTALAGISLSKSLVNYWENCHVVGQGEGCPVRQPDIAHSQAQVGLSDQGTRLNASSIAGDSGGCVVYQQSGTLAPNIASLPRQRASQTVVHGRRLSQQNQSSSRPGLANPSLPLSRWHPSSTPRNYTTFRRFITSPVSDGRASVSSSFIDRVNNHVTETWPIDGSHGDACLRATIGVRAPYLDVVFDEER